MKDITEGKVYVVYDDINTDVIIPGRYQNTSDPNELAKHAMEDLIGKDYPIPFLNEDKSCDYKIIVAGKNFGCGSSREHAPLALHTAGIEAIIANSFARIFFRNSINGAYIFLLLTNIDLTKVIKTGDIVKISLSEQPTVEHKGQIYPLKSFSGFVKDVFESGGLIAYTKKQLGL